jgi:Uncharacterized iron-regulated protein
MVTRYLAAFAVIGLGLSLVCADQTKPAPAKADSAAVAKLVAQLGSDRYEDREAAVEALDALGPIALEALRSALANGDLETRRRAIDLVQRIEKRLESAQLTRPKMVHLVYSDTPLTEAVQDMARKTGFQIQLEGDQTKFANRKITLDTGEVPFWQAVDQFCIKAELVERGSMAISEQANTEVVGVARLYCLTEKDGGYGGPRPELPVVFLDGKPQPMPTYYGGAVRVRVLPRAASNAGAAQSGTPVNNPEGGTLLTVEVSPEPKMGWQKVLNVRVEKVIDEHGNELRAPLPYICEPSDYGDVEPCGRLLNLGYLGPARINTASTQVPFRLHAPKEVKKLKEIHGYVAAEVLTPLQPLITVENILDAAGKTVRGDGEGSLTVSEVKRDEKGQITLRVVVDKLSASPTYASRPNAYLAGRQFSLRVAAERGEYGRKDPVAIR